MNLLLLHGIGEKRILAKETAVTGTVTKVQKCWWIKINTKPVRRYSTDGAVYPHIVRFTYTVNGTAYPGMRFAGWKVDYPSEGQPIRVYYDPDSPERYAVRLAKERLNS